nr:hypothetical protein [Bacillota bacterium]
MWRKRSFFWRKTKFSSGLVDICGPMCFFESKDNNDPVKPVKGCSAMVHLDPETMEKIQALRREVDRIDEEIVQALKRRMDLIRQIALLKEDPKAVTSLATSMRHKEILEHVGKCAKECGLDEEMVQELYQMICWYAIDKQLELFEKDAEA